MAIATVNEREQKKELKKVKVRLRSLVGTERLPIELTILPRVKAIFDENAIAEVTEVQSRMLLGPGHVGEGWELVKDEPALKGLDVTISDPKAAAKIAKTMQAPSQEVNKEFLDKVRG